MRFLTLFPKCENVHLIKDVGMIPYVLHKAYSFDATIACYENGDYNYLDAEVNGLKQVFVARIFKNSHLNIIIFLLLNFRKYDVLQLYHFSFSSIIYLTIFRVLNIFNYRSKTYLKLDADDDILKLRLRGPLGKIARILVNGISVISIETKSLYQQAKEKGIFAENLVYMPNGFYDWGRKTRIDFDQKEKVFITVGRIGTYQKANEILLKAFKEVCIIDSEWKLKIVGPIDPNFKLFVDQFFVENAFVRDRIIFFGSVTDRNTLRGLYEKSQIFILSSRYESFGLVFIEAMLSGCTLISTKITPAYDVTDNGKFGLLFPIDDYHALANQMTYLIADRKFLADNCVAIQEYVHENFYWPDVLKIVVNRLNKS